MISIIVLLIIEIDNSRILDVAKSPKITNSQKSKHAKITRSTVYLHHTQDAVLVQFSLCAQMWPKPFYSFAGKPVGDEFFSSTVSEHHLLDKAGYCFSNESQANLFIRLSYC